MPVGHKVFSFFSGAGFLDLGFELEDGFQIEMVNEYEPKFMSAYIYARKKLGIDVDWSGCRPESIDVFNEKGGQEFLSRSVKRAKNEGLVGFIGGPPCPDFSVGGKNKGREGDNGRLSKSYVDIICKQRPDWFLFENVKGLLRTERHRKFFEELRTQLQAAGFQTTHCVVNALEYGVPQDRDRVFLFGVHKRVGKVLGLKSGSSIPDQRFNWGKFAKFESVEEIKKLPWPTTNRFGATSSRPTGVPKELTVAHWFEKNRVEDHPNSKNVFVPRAGLKKFQTIEEGDDSKKSYKRLHRWRYSPTAAYGNNEVHLHPFLARRITVAEALAIQSLPANFILPPDETLSALFKMVGNGVPFLLANGLAHHVRDFFSELHEIDSFRPRKGHRESSEESCLQLL